MNQRPRQLTRNVKTGGGRRLRRISKAEKRGADTNESHRQLLRQKLAVEIERKRLDLAERQGLLVERDAVEGKLLSMFSVIRARLQSLPGEIASCMPAEVRGQVMEEVAAKVVIALKELAKRAD